MSSSRLGLRPVTRDDADTVVAIVRAMDEAVLGSSDYTRRDLDDDWRTLDPGRNAWLVVDGDEPIAYGYVDDRGDPPRADGYVHGAHFGRGAGTLLVGKMEDALRERGARTIRNGVLLADEPAQSLLRSRGYTEVRRFSQMRIELTESPPAPAWPSGLTVSGLLPADGPAYHAAYEDAFADHWGHLGRSFEEWRPSHMEGPDFAPELWAVVRDGDRIVAGSELIRERNGVAWISRLFTARDWRRRGIGEALLHDAFGKFWREGRREIGLGVDAQSNTGANRLYERVGMHVHWGAVVFEQELV
jgi:ribosomal protein S18 acetylase RimI-like enzyme